MYITRILATFMFCSVNVKKYHIFQFTVSGHLGVDGPPALSPVDVELNIEVGEFSDMLDMVAGDVMEVVGLDDPVTKEDIVKV